MPSNSATTNTLPANDDNLSENEAFHAESVEEITTPTDESYEKTLLINRMIRGGFAATVFLIICSQAFIGYNVSNNTFFIEENLEDFQKAILPTAVIFAAATYFSNLLSKTTELVDALDALKLNQGRSFFLNLISNSPKKNTALAILKKIEENPYDDAKVVVCVDQDMLRLFGATTTPIPTEFTKTARFIMARYWNSTHKKRKLELISREDLRQFQTDYHNNNSTTETPQPLVILTKFDPDLDEIIKPTIPIRFYSENWLQRIRKDSEKSFRLAFCTTSKALGNLIFIFAPAKLFPGLVVMLTGYVTLDKLESHTADFDCTKQHPLSSLLFWLCLLKFGFNTFVGGVKTGVNNSLKGGQTERKLHQVLEKIYHKQPIKYNALHLGLTTIISVPVLTYMEANALFFITNGIRKGLNEVSSILGITIPMAHQARTAVTAAVAVATIPITIVTCSLPFYLSLSEKSAQYQGSHKWFYRAFQLASFLDGVITGSNAWGVTHHAWDHLEEISPGFNLLSEKYPDAQIATQAIVACCITLVTLYFSIQNGAKKFTAVMQIFDAAGAKAKEKTVNARDTLKDIPKHLHRALIKARHCWLYRRPPHAMIIEDDGARLLERGRGGLRYL